MADDFGALLADLDTGRIGASLFADEARRTVTQAIDARAALGQSASPTVVRVNGVEAGWPAPFEGLKPGTTVVATFEDQGDIVAWIMAEIRSASPVLTGRYRDSHVLLADGARVEAVRPGLTAREWVVVAGEPYARKIERGLSRRAADGVYQAVAARAAARFGNRAAIKFTFRAPVAGTDAASWGEQAAMRVRRSRVRAVVRVPCVTIVFG